MPPPRARLPRRAHPIAGSPPAPDALGAITYPLRFSRDFDRLGVDLDPDLAFVEEDRAERGPYDGEREHDEAGDDQR
jgi:hypothetical protein